MVNRPAFLLFIAAIACSSPQTRAADESEQLILNSPNGKLSLTFQLSKRGQPEFTVSWGEMPVTKGTLGLDLLAAEPLDDQLKVVDTQHSAVRAKYEIAVGKASTAQNHHNGLVIQLAESVAPHRQLSLEFRAFDDGVGLRYLLPKQDGLEQIVITDERTQLSFPGEPLTKALPLAGYTTPYESYYETKPISQLKPDRLIGLPLLLQYSEQRVWIAVTEADLTDYAGMYLSPLKGNTNTLVSKLSPLPAQTEKKVIAKTPFQTPWRVLMVGDNPGRLIESNIIFNLSDGPAIKDTSWIKPGKTTFPWWNHYVLEGVDFEPGVNTATMKHYIDFCAEQGIPYHSLDGLDIAWYGGPIAPSGPTDITKAAPSIDLPELLRYAKAKGVRLRLWMHWKALKPQIDEAFAKYEEWSIEGVMVDFMDRDDQEMVRFYHEMAEKAAKHHLTVTLHGAYKPTGLERKWPNVLTFEGALNQEYNKWSMKGTAPEHNLDIAFVRMLAGPLDYHQGGMRSVLPEKYRFRDLAPPVQGTRGHQLAMYVVYQNHLPMMADFPEAYRGQAGLDFITEVPTTWDETRVLYAEMDRCLVIARRNGGAWYLGGMTASNERELELPLDFLGDGSFTADLYLDDSAGGPTSLTNRTLSLSAADKLKVIVPRAGGFAARLKRIAR